MLYVFTGTDMRVARAHVARTAETLKKRRPEALFIRLNEENAHTFSPEELVASQGLFYRHYIVLFDHLFSGSEADKFIPFIESYARAPHIFLVLDTDLNKEAEDALKKHAEKWVEFSQKKPPTHIPQPRREKNGDVLFKFADAYASHTCSWESFREVVKEFPAEQIHGVLFWALKNLYLTHSGEGRELKPFQQKKYTNYLQKWDDDELLTAFHRITCLPQKAYRTGVPLAQLLEREILTLSC